MKRWWADADVAREVLACVDGRSAPEGVSTAFLGLHALQRESLMALASSTLVDGAVVDAHLRDVDVTPVAKAIEAATAPVMGASAGEYGRLMAVDMAERSREAAQAMLGSWTSRGMPWPTAVQRLSTVVGVPSRSLGKAPEQLRSPILELVAEDFGDRALMAHAKLLASTQPDAVAKSLTPMELVRFNEEHPRDEQGQFATKPAAGREARLARRARRRRRRERLASDWAAYSAQQAQEQQARQAQEQAAEQGFMDGFFDRINESLGRGRRVGRQRQRQREERREGRLGRLRRVGNAAQSMLPKTDPQEAVVVATPGYLVIDRSEMDRMIVDLDSTKFNIRGLAQLLGKRGITAVDRETVEDMLANGYYDRGIRDPLVVELHNLAVIDNNGLDVGSADYDLAENAEYELIDPISKPPYGNRVDYNTSNTTFYMPAKGGSPAYSGLVRGTPVDTVSFVLQNESDFKGIGRTPKELPHDRFGKELSGSELVLFNEEHPRDAEGQFTVKAPLDPAEARRARRERRRRRADRRWIEAQQFKVRRVEQAPDQQEQQAVDVGGTVRERGDRADRFAQRRIERSQARRAENTRLVRREALERLKQVYGEAKEKLYDFANAEAMVLDDQQLTDLFGKNIFDEVVDDPEFRGAWDPEDFDAVMNPVRENGLAALHKVATQASKDGKDFTGPLPAQDELQGYSTDWAAAQAALEYINDWQMRVSTTMTWDAGAEQRPHPDTGKMMWFPIRVGYRPDDSKVLVFGSTGAFNSIRDGVDPSRLKPIPAATLKDLLALRATDEPLAAIANADTFPNPAVHAFWYEDRDDKDIEED